MNTYVVLLRGVNVGGKNSLPMKALKALLERSGYQDVLTYIQSGNIVLKADSIPTNIASLIEAEFGFKPDVMVLTTDEFEQIIVENPYPNFDGKTVHFYFCHQIPPLSQAKLETYKDETESYTVIGRVFYLHAPNGIGRSKLVANIDKCLGTSGTGRNLNTIQKLKAMLA